jgi:hypothetical protein
MYRAVKPRDPSKWRPRRLRPLEAVSRAFGEAVRRRLAYVAWNSGTVYKELADGNYRVPRPIAELYEAWCLPSGPLHGVGIDTAAALGLEVFFEELRAHEARTTAAASAAALQTQP